MRRVIFSTIMRDCEKSVKYYIANLEELSKAIKSKFNYDCELSLYASDCVDNTVQNLSDLVVTSSIFRVISADINNFQKFGSVKSAERVINLAWCRNRTINQYISRFGNFNHDDIIISVEPDITYSIQTALNLFSDFVKENNDIRSGIIVHPNGAGRHIDEVHRFYDTWALRQTEHDVSGDIFEDFKENPVRNVWSTYSGFCIYRGKYFAEGGRFGYANPRLGVYDCDTAVICENFRVMGYNNIVMDQSKVFYHL